VAARSSRTRSGSFTPISRLSTRQVRDGTVIRSDDERITRAPKWAGT
jgi:hypothetical protein